jgi:hypothetical protein
LHAFVRWDDGVCRRNIETTDGGREIDDEKQLFFRSAPRIHRSAVKRGVYLTSRRKKEALSWVLHRRAYEIGCWRGLHEQALAAMEDSVRLQPDSVKGRALKAQ